MARLFCRLSMVVVAACMALARDASPPQLAALRQALHASDLATVIDGGAVSGNGRFVAFVSRGRLLSTDTRGTANVYVFDRMSGTVSLETVAADGTASNGSSLHPRLSADGRFLVFTSTATNLTGQSDSNQTTDVFVRDRIFRTIRRVSSGPGGHEGNDTSGWPAISNDGHVVVFASSATNLIGAADAGSGAREIYLARLDTGDLTCISIGTDGREHSGGDSHSPTLSGDGRVVAFVSAATLAQTATTRSSRARAAEAAVLVRDLGAGTTTCVSCTDVARRPTRHAYAPHLSGDGRIVVFTSSPGGSPERTDIAVHDRTTFQTTLITHRANASSVRARISGNGRFIALESLASNLECATSCRAESIDENLLSDIYLFDRQTAAFTRVSGGRQPWWVPSVGPWLDAEGAVVIFSSRQPVGPDDPTTDFDLFVHSGERLSAAARR